MGEFSLNDYFCHFHKTLSFNIAYSYWALLLCPVIGAAYAVGFYYKDKRTSGLSPFLRWLASGLRFVLVTLLVFLFLAPLIKSTKNNVEKPIIIIAEDNSASIVAGKDSGFYKHDLQAAWDKIINDMSSKYDVRVMSFGERPKDTMNYRYDEKETDISSLFQELTQRYYGKNLGAIILSTDGIYNKGYSPIYAARQFNCCVFTVALGDTTVKVDAVVSKVENNPTAFLGNSFPLLITVDATKLQGKSSNLTVTELDGDKEQSLFTKPISFNSQIFHQSIPVQLNANSAGLKHYVVKLAIVEGEENLVNNRKDVYIRVLDQKQKVLILSNPHPDVAAIAECINSSDGFEAQSFTPEKFPGELNKYSLVILNQLPSNSKPITDILKNIKGLGIPIMYVLGSETDVQAFNGLNEGFKINSQGTNSSDAEPALAKDFSLFTLNDDSRNYFSQLTALSSPFGNYVSSPTLNVLCYQKIQSVTTNYPLIAFNNASGEKSCIIAGEGIFRWRLKDYADHKNNHFFDELINKMVQYLAVKEDKSFFRIHAPNSFKEDEPVEMDADLYNPSYQLVNDPEVSIVITNSDGKNFSYTFSRTSNAYHLNAGQLQAGTYHYAAQVKQGTQVYTSKGEFTVTPVQVEATNTVADHQLLYQLAKEHGGKMLFPNQISELPKLIDSKEDIKPVIYTHTSYAPLIDLKWVFFFLLLLMSVEWFIRKWSGTY
jgi:hypothetical protein